MRTDDPLHPLTIRTAFEQAVSWYVERVGAVADAQWTAPGLGEWDVRQLVAHGARSIVLPATYLDATGAGNDATPLAPGPFGYWDGIFSRLSDEQRAALAAQVAERGRQSAAELGDSPVQAVWAMADGALNRLATASDTDVVTSPFGRLALIDFLASRVVELVVHGLDVCRATGQPLAVPPAPMAVTLAMLTGYGDPARVVLALTGREPYAVLA